MKSNAVLAKVNRHIDSLIHRIRGQRVIFDADLAAIYGTSTKRLNEQVKRNKGRFPEDFCFRLTIKEWKEFLALRSQNATASAGVRSQNATASKRNIRFTPYAFTEHGAIMAANVLNSKRAVQMSIFVVRAFIKMRQTMSANRAFLEKLEELEKKLTQRLDSHEQAIVYVLAELRKLMEPPQLPEPRRGRIGFQSEE